MLRLHRQIRQRLVAEIGIGGFIRQLVGFQLQARPAFKLRKQLVGAQPEFCRWQERAHRVHAPVLIARLRFTLEALGAAFQIAGIDHQRICREIAEQRRQRLAKKQRLPVFDPRRQRAFAYLLIDMLGVALNVEVIAPLAAEQLDRGLVGRELMGGQQVDGVNFLQRALGIGIKQTQAVDFIIKEIETIGLRAAHRATGAGLFSSPAHDRANSCAGRRAASEY